MSQCLEKAPTRNSSLRKETIPTCPMAKSCTLNTSEPRVIEHTRAVDKSNVSIEISGNL